MDELDLDAIKARADAATPGPWRLRWRGQELALLGRDDEDDNEMESVAEWTYAVRPWVQADMEECDTADAEFIAHARTDVPALLARVAELEAERGEARRRNARLVEMLMEAEEQSEGDRPPPLTYTDEECAAVMAEVADHPRRYVIDAIAEATYDLDNDSTEGGGGGMVYHLERAYALVEYLPALAYDESVLCDEPGCGAHPHSPSEIRLAAEARGRQWAIDALRDEAARFHAEGDLNGYGMCTLAADRLEHLAARPDHNRG